MVDSPSVHTDPVHPIDPVHPTDVLLDVNTADRQAKVMSECCDATGTTDQHMQHQVWQYHAERFHR